MLQSEPSQDCCQQLNFVEVLALSRRRVLNDCRHLVCYSLSSICLLPLMTYDGSEVVKMTCSCFCRLLRAAKTSTIVSFQHTHGCLPTWRACHLAMSTAHCLLGTVLYICILMQSPSSSMLARCVQFWGKCFFVCCLLGLVTPLSRPVQWGLCLAFHQKYIIHSQWCTEVVWNQMYQ